MSIAGLEHSLELAWINTSCWIEPSTQATGLLFAVVVGVHTRWCGVSHIYFRDLRVAVVHYPLPLILVLTSELLRRLSA